MKKLLITGGTVFVSRYTAEYFAGKGYTVYVLNRNRHAQPERTHLIEGDRHHLGGLLKSMEFDAVIDVTAYTGEDVAQLLCALGGFRDYILISSSAVYPETAAQPFPENTGLGRNRFWGDYGTNKIAAEKTLLAGVPSAYILRPPYLYGPMNNVYREAFVFDCAMRDRKFYLPKDGSLRLQFFHIRDLCRMMEKILDARPKQHIFNVGNYESVSVRDWVTLCYQAAGKQPVFEEVTAAIDQRQYFSFYDYEYALDVSAQRLLLPGLIPLEDGLMDSCLWYREHPKEVNRKGYMDFIDTELER